MNIAFIGLGMMGRPMAECLIAKGFSVRVYDIDPASSAEFGNASAPSPAEAAAEADIIVTMLPNGEIVRQALLGENGALASAAPNSIVIDTSSSDAGGTVALGAELAAHGITLIDSPVSGGVPMAREGTLALMVGGAEDDTLYARVQPVLEAMGKRIVRVGGLGAGHAAKAINNAIAAATLAATAEGLVLGEKFGLKPDILLDVFNNSTGRSAVSESVFRTQILPRTYAQGFAMALMTKDVGLAENLRAQLGLNLPMLQATCAQWREALADSAPGTDFTAYHLFTEKRAG